LPPSEEQIQIQRSFDLEKQCILVKVSLKKPGWIIKSLIAESEACFENGMQIVQPLGSNQASSELSVEINSAKFTNETVNIRIMMGAGANAPQFLIHHAQMKLKRFDFLMPLSTEEYVFRFP
jgi:hypothetical protein